MNRSGMPAGPNCAETHVLDQYRQYGRSLYSRFAETVAEILESAIGDDGEYRLQHIQRRAKGVDSLTRRLEEAGKQDTPNIEDHRKDLAGCRIIFTRTMTSPDLRSSPTS